MISETENRKFWDQQAALHGGSDLATAPDHHYRKLEIDSILRIIGTIKHDTILDVGCGNGYSTLQIAKKFPEAMVTGIDFSPAMIEEANKNVIPNVDFFDGNVLSLSSNKELVGQYFDVVLSTRCLINLSDWKEQKAGISEMQRLLAPNGRLIMVENFQDGMNALNKLRNNFGLHPIKVRWHNKYLELSKVSEFISSIPLLTEYCENIGNMYYIASRVIYAKLCKDQGIEPDYENPINAIASQLPTMGEFYACSPNYMFVFRNQD